MILFRRTICKVDFGWENDMYSYDFVWENDM